MAREPPLRFEESGDDLPLDAAFKKSPLRLKLRVRSVKCVEWVKWAKWVLVAGVLTLNIKNGSTVRHAQPPLSKVHSGVHCGTLLLMRHGMRQDHATDTIAFYRDTDAPWDAPLHQPWVRRHVRACRPQWQRWLSQWGKLDIATSPLKRAVHTAQEIANMTDTSGTIRVESCAIERWSNMRAHIARYQSAFSPPRAVRPDLVDSAVVADLDTRSRGASCVFKNAHDGLSSQHLRQCCGPLSGPPRGGHVTTARRIQCLASCMRDAASGTTLLVSHSYIARNLCYVLTRDPWCLLGSIGYMETLELRRVCEADQVKHAKWTFVARHAAPLC